MFCASSHGDESSATIWPPTFDCSLNTPRLCLSKEKFEHREKKEYSGWISVL